MHYVVQGMYSLGSTKQFPFLIMDLGCFVESITLLEQKEGIRIVALYTFPQLLLIQVIDSSSFYGIVEIGRGCNVINRYCLHCLTWYLLRLLSILVVSDHIS